MNHGDPYPRFAALSCLFIVSDQTPKLREPGECPLYDPPFLQNRESKGLGFVAPLDDFNAVTGEAIPPFDKPACVTPIGKENAKTWESRPKLHHDQLAAVSILVACIMSNNHKEQTKRVYRNVTLAPFDPFAGVVAVGPPFCGVRND